MNSQTSYCIARLKFSFLGFFLPKDPQNLVSLIAPQAHSSIESFNFLCSAVQKFYFGDYFVYPSPPKSAVRDLWKIPSLQKFRFWPEFYLLV